VTGFVADYNQRGKRHIFTAFDDFGNAIDGNQLVF
jgi:hypothetical protein